MQSGCKMPDYAVRLATSYTASTYGVPNPDVTIRNVEAVRIIDGAIYFLGSHTMGHFKSFENGSIETEHLLAAFAKGCWIGVSRLLEDKSDG